MTIVTLPLPRTKENAPGNAKAVAQLIRDAVNPPAYPGPSPANGDTCTMCGTTPPSGQLNKIVIDTAANTGVMIGIDVCTHEHLGPALHDLLARERAGTHPNKASRVQRLQDAITALGC